VIRFNAEGSEGLRDRPRSGRPPWPDDGQLAAFKALVLRGPDPERDGVSAWRAKDLCRIVADRFGVSYTENGLLRLLHDLGLSWQKARPIHPEADRQAQARQKNVPALIAAIAREHPEAERLEVWFLDEARVGQTGRVGRRWSIAAGARAACATCATRRSTCSGRSVPNATWRRSGPARGQRRRDAGDARRAQPGRQPRRPCGRADAIRANLTPLFLPPYSPELNAVTSRVVVRSCGILACRSASPSCEKAAAPWVSWSRGVWRRRPSSAVVYGRFCASVGAAG
jgi:transposase